eukprot:GHVT01039325.1.p1 GENE.GHVT01039325.1~~GHVT01039325.1.p1  ORF type:complete len:839 (+),score=116.10 GHVT01039325.1:259-2775(+)
MVVRVPFAAVAVPLRRICGAPVSVCGFPNSVSSRLCCISSRLHQNVCHLSTAIPTTLLPARPSFAQQTYPAPLEGSTSSRFADYVSCARASPAATLRLLRRMVPTSVAVASLSPPSVVRGGASWKALSRSCGVPPASSVAAHLGEESFRCPACPAAHDTASCVAVCRRIYQTAEDFYPPQLLEALELLASVSVSDENVAAAVVGRLGDLIGIHPSPYRLERLVRVCSRLHLCHPAILTPVLQRLPENAHTFTRELQPLFVGLAGLLVNDAPVIDALASQLLSTHQYLKNNFFSTFEAFTRHFHFPYPQLVRLLLSKVDAATSPTLDSGSRQSQARFLPAIATGSPESSAVDQRVLPAGVPCSTPRISTPTSSPISNVVSSGSSAREPSESAFGSERVCSSFTLKDRLASIAALSRIASWVGNSNEARACACQIQRLRRTVTREFAEAGGNASDIKVTTALTQMRRLRLADPVILASALERLEESLGSAAYIETHLAPQASSIAELWPATPRIGSLSTTQQEDFVFEESNTQPLRSTGSSIDVLWLALSGSDVVRAVPRMSTARLAFLLHAVASLTFLRYSGASQLSTPSDFFHNLCALHPLLHALIEGMQMSYARLDVGSRRLAFASCLVLHQMITTRRDAASSQSEASIKRLAAPLLALSELLSKLPPLLPLAPLHVSYRDYQVKVLPAGHSILCSDSAPDELGVAAAEMCHRPSRSLEENSTLPRTCAQMNGHSLSRASESATATAPTNPACPAWVGHFFVGVQNLVVSPGRTLPRLKTGEDARGLAALSAAGAVSRRTEMHLQVLESAVGMAGGTLRVHLGLPRAFYLPHNGDRA